MDKTQDAELTLEAMRLLRPSNSFAFVLATTMHRPEVGPHDGGRVKSSEATAPVDDWAHKERAGRPGPFLSSGSAGLRGY